MKRLKTILCILTAVASCAAVIPLMPAQTAAFALQTQIRRSNGLFYSVDGNEITITGLISESPSSIVIPSQIEGLPVTAIGFAAIGTYGGYDRSKLTEVILPATVKRIDHMAFYGCNKLTSIVLPEGVTEIAGDAFADCTALANVTIPAGLTHFGSDAFLNTAWLNAQRAANPLVCVNGVLLDGKTASGNVTVPAGITKICDGAFRNNSAMTAVSLPETVTEIAANAFGDCKALTAVSLPGTAEIGKNAFRGCTKLSSVTYSAALHTVGYNAFDETAWLQAQRQMQPLVTVNSVLADGRAAEGDTEIPAGVTEIGAYAFHDNKKLTAAILPETVTAIQDYAFAYCDNLQNVTVPIGVTEIGDCAFRFCDNLTLSVYDESYALQYAKTHQFSYSVTRMKGDFVCDGRISVEDAQAVLQYYVSVLSKQPRTLTFLEKNAADYDESGEISVEDAQMILEVYVRSLAKHDAEN